MESDSIIGLVVAPAAAGIIALAISILAFRARIATKPFRTGVVLAVLPAVGMAGLFYSLAIHMRCVLGAWPVSIGERGFPPSLIAHGQIACDYFAIIFLASVFVWPIVFLLCYFIRRWRVAIPCLGAYALSFVVCFGSMLLAPSRFLNWWWD